MIRTVPECLDHCCDPPGGSVLNLWRALIQRMLIEVWRASCREAHVMLITMIPEPSRTWPDVAPRSSW